ncbi:ABC transporter permease [Rhodomicrobium vannielii]|uniref:ABC transporter permease n=1 Tax=Rhodomicrobium vannielii TaxID=1069 RepID=UPI001FEE1592|nr:iron ABC transporter permease [Rhodomicrobium vannielii]
MTSQPQAADERPAPWIEVFGRRRAKGRKPPLFLMLPAIVAGGMMLIPLVYLVVRASATERTELAAIVLRPFTLEVTLNTLALVGSVLALTTAIALPLALIVTRTDVPAKRAITILATLPLAIPGYVMAYALIGLSGYYGPLNAFFGLRLPRPEGLFGAALALSLYTFPYVFLNVRAALLGLDPALEESARSLGRSPRAAFLSVTLPHLRPALLSAWLVVALYTLGDYGAIALMRYDVLSSAIFSQYANAFEVNYAAWLALMLLAIAAAFLVLEGALNRGRRLARTGTGTRRSIPVVGLGRWRWPALGFAALVHLASLGVPALVIAFWLSRAPADVDWAKVPATVLGTLSVALPAAALAVAIAVPVALVATRWPSRLTYGIERMTYFGYAVPALPFALATVFFTLAVVPALYQTLAILVIALALHSAALAVGPVRVRLLQIGPRVEESARSFGYSAPAAFCSVTLPALSRSVLAGAIFVFIMVAKELPITLLLAPSGFTTMAMNVFSRTHEGMLYEAAPYAALMIAFSAISVALMLRSERDRP